MAAYSDTANDEEEETKKSTSLTVIEPRDPSFKNMSAAMGTKDRYSRKEASSNARTMRRR